MSDISTASEIRIGSQAATEVWLGSTKIWPSFQFLASLLPTSSGLFSVTYGNGKFVGVGASVAASSTDGINWTSLAFPYGNSFSVTYGNGKFVAVINNSNKAYYSTNGITWTATNFPSSAQWYSVTYGNGKFVAVAYNSNHAAYANG